MIGLAALTRAGFGRRRRRRPPALAELAKLARLVLAGPGASEALCARLGVRGLHGDFITAAHDVAGRADP